MSGMGPAPKPPEQRARRNKPPTANMTLPVEGYMGDVPDWPVGTQAFSDTQEDMWQTLWRTPQAYAWSTMGDGVKYEVAEYIRFMTEDVQNAAQERRQLSDRLGLNPLAMRRLGWEMAKSESSVRMDAGPDEPTPTRPGARYAGLRAVAK